MGLIASNSGLPLAPSSRLACGLLTIDTTATPPELEAAFLGAHSAIWKRRPKCPPASAGRSTSIYILALVPTVHDVIHGPGIFNAQLARHGQPLPTRPKGVNSDTCRGLRKPLPSICDIAFGPRRFSPPMRWRRLYDWQGAFLCGFGPRQRSSRNRLFGHVSNNSNPGRYLTASDKVGDKDSNLKL